MTCDKCNGTGKFTIGAASDYQCSRCLGTGQAMIGASYAGIGSRETPLPVIREMENIAMQLALRGFVLRSGAAKPKPDAPVDTDSADLAFERGAAIVKGRKIIRVPTVSPAAMEHAARYHPNWSACNEHARALHARNSLIMLGDWLDDPVRFVVCWTAGGKIAGGTGQALRIAVDPMYNIPVFNLAIPGAVATLWSWLG